MMRVPWCSRITRKPSRTLSSDVISTGILVQPGGGGLGALRSKPTTSLKRPAKRRITALPILPLEPVTITMPFSATITVPPSCTFDYLCLFLFTSKMIHGNIWARTFEQKSVDCDQQRVVPEISKPSRELPHFLISVC